MRFRTKLGPVLLLLPLAASGCSVAGYEKPVAAFAEATKSSTQSLGELSNTVTGQVRTMRRQEVLATPAKLFVPPTECLAVDSARCRAYVRSSPADPQPRELSPDPALQQMLVLMDQMKRYTDGLQAIIAADTKAQVDASVAATSGSLSNLAKSVAPTAPAAQEIIPPATAAIGWIAGVYIDSVKYNALKSATRMAEPLVQAAVPVFTRAAEQAGRAVRAQLAEDVSVHVDRFRNTKDSAALSGVTESAEAYDALLQAPPADLFGKLGESHTALERALNNPSLGFADAFAKIEDFGKEAEKLAKIVSDLQKASKG
jgi:hypothetical protein